MIKSLGFGVYGTGFRVKGLEYGVPGFGFRVYSSGSRVKIYGFRVYNLGFKGSRFKGNSLRLQLQFRVYWFRGLEV